MQFRRHFFKKIFLSFCVLCHLCTMAAPAKKHKTRKKHYARTVQVLMRPDLKIVNSVAKPVVFTAPELTVNTLTKQNSVKPAVQLLGFIDPRESIFNDKKPLNPKLPQLDWAQISKKMYTQNGKFYANYNNLKLELTINPEIQDAAERFLHQNRGVISGSTAIIEPHTGRLLALAQGGNQGNAAISVSSRGPAASLIKIVTSAAAIEKENLEPSYELSFRGGCGHLVNQNWIENKEKDNLSIAFDKAFGSSCNTFFARLALYHVGLSSLRQYAERFLFNKPIPSDIKIQTSLFWLPEADSATPQEIAEAGSGFGATKLSPIHAALLSATIANGGIMMAPYLVEAIFNERGIEIYRARPTQVGRVVSKNTADKLSVLMLATTSLGTSRRVFHKRGTQANIDDIGGKTGTLLDLENRQILYTWFSGIASMGSPQSIAIGTVVASPQNYVVRANAVAQTTIAEYFKLLKLEDND